MNCEQPLLKAVLLTNAGTSIVLLLKKCLTWTPHPVRVGSVLSANAPQHAGPHYSRLCFATVFRTFLSSI